MDEMKYDMSGAASVFGTIKAAAMMKLPLNIVGITPITENTPTAMPSTVRLDRSLFAFSEAEARRRISVMSMAGAVLTRSGAPRQDPIYSPATPARSRRKPR